MDSMKLSELKERCRKGDYAAWPSHTVRELVAEIERLQEAAAQQTCLWKYDEYNSTFDTACGKRFFYEDVISGELTENNVIYCQKCGGKIEEVIAPTQQEVEG